MVRQQKGEQSITAPGRVSLLGLSIQAMLAWIPCCQGLAGRAGKPLPVLNDDSQAGTAA